MKEIKKEIRLDFITGLKEFVLGEIATNKGLKVLREDRDSLYLDFVYNFSRIKSMRSIVRAHVVVQDPKFNPLYITNHKSILGELVEIVLASKGEDSFKTFKISCAGSDSKEVRSIANYISSTYGLVETEHADLKLHIIKSNLMWEVGVEITSRPFSLRDYKVQNMSGAMDPTIAYCLNSLCNLGSVDSYLNIFSGSATLLIEAGQCFPDIKKLIGFDNDKQHISLAIQNIKKAGLIRRIQLKEKNIFDKPDLGKFDAITGDLPFGMTISKGEDLGELYRCFIDYCEESLNIDGTLAVYTSEYKLIEKVISTSKFEIVKKIELMFVTSVDSYLRPRIYMCKFK